MTLLPCRAYFYKSGKSGREYAQHSTFHVKTDEETEKDLNKLIALIK